MSGKSLGYRRARLVLEQKWAETILFDMRADLLLQKPNSPNDGCISVVQGPREEFNALGFLRQAHYHASLGSRIPRGASDLAAFFPMARESWARLDA
jgi:hypothetical protein